MPKKALDCRYVHFVKKSNQNRGSKLSQKTFNWRCFACTDAHGRKRKTASMPESQYKYSPLRLVLCTRYCTYCTYSAHTHAAPRLAVSTAAVEAVGSWGKRRAAVRRCGVRCARRARRAAVASGAACSVQRAVAVCGGNGAAGAAVRRCGVRGAWCAAVASRAACGSGVRRRWRGGCGGNGKALYFNAAPYIYSATHSVSLTSTTRLQSWVAL